MLVPEGSGSDHHYTVASSPAETLVQWFVNIGVDINTIDFGYRALTPITDAVYCSIPAAVSLFLSRDATLIHRMLQNAMRRLFDDDVAAVTMFDCLLEHDPGLINHISEINPSLLPGRNIRECRKLDFRVPMHWVAWNVEAM